TSGAASSVSSASPRSDLLPRAVAERRLVDRHDGAADRPEREPRQLEMRPGERDADDRDRQHDGEHEMAERQPPARENEPDDVADGPERAGAGVLAAVMLGARYRLMAERQEGINRDIEGGARPRDTDDGDRHDHAGDQPGKPHPDTAAEDPKHVEQKREEGHGVTRRCGSRLDR